MQRKFFLTCFISKLENWRKIRKTSFLSFLECSNKSYSESSYACLLKRSADCNYCKASSSWSILIGFALFSPNKRFRTLIALFSFLPFIQNLVLLKFLFSSSLEYYNSKKIEKFNSFTTICWVWMNFVTRYSKNLKTDSALLLSTVFLPKRLFLSFRLINFYK